MIENQICQRCGKKCDATIMSMFNTEVICRSYRVTERQARGMARPPRQKPLQSLVATTGIGRRA